MSWNLPFQSFNLPVIVYTVITIRYEKNINAGIGAGCKAYG